jgi:beta-phosphoglucomutase-like phosphatase (HAD superfamily)
VIKAVIFDMDGLILDSERLSFLGWKNVEKSFDIEVSSEIYIETIGKNKEEIKDIFISYFSSDLDFERLYKKREKFIKNEIKKGFNLMKAGLNELLSFLSEKNIKKIIASSANKNRIKYMCKTAKILENFDVIVSGQDIKKGKPAPDIFNLAVKKSSFSKDECIVLEDSMNGVKAALSAGIKTIHIPDKSSLLFWTNELPKTDKKAVRMDSLFNVIPFIKKLNRE